MAKQSNNEFKKRLYIFTLRLIEFLDRLHNDNVSKRIGDQLLRSGTSIVANFAEGQAANGKKEYTQYFHYSLKSANESKLWLGLLRDSKRVEASEANKLLAELDEIANIFASSILTLKGKR
ncbi:MAG: four helix bundle protein [Phycisphaerae bacterium]|jgi:four helix bundle protein